MLRQGGGGLTQPCWLLASSARGLKRRGTITGVDFIFKVLENTSRMFHLTKQRHGKMQKAHLFRYHSDGSSFLLVTITISGKQKKFKNKIKFSFHVRLWSWSEVTTIKHNSRSPFKYNMGVFVHHSPPCTVLSQNTSFRGLPRIPCVYYCRSLQVRARFQIGLSTTKGQSIFSWP